MKKVTISRDTKIEILFLISVFILYTMWAILIPFGECPDEPFRYKIPDYIYQFGKLPKGIHRMLWMMPGEFPMHLLRS